MIESLQAISNVIELKPDKRYLLVFKGESFDYNEMGKLLATLHEMGIYAMGIALQNGNELEVIEAPATQEGGQQ